MQIPTPTQQRTHKRAPMITAAIASGTLKAIRKTKTPASREATDAQAAPITSTQRRPTMVQQRMVQVQGRQTQQMQYKRKAMTPSPSSGHVVDESQLELPVEHVLEYLLQHFDEHS